MTFFQRIKNMLGIAGAQIVGQDNQPLTSEQDKEIENSVEFSKLLQEEHAQHAENQKASIKDMQASIDTLRDFMNTMQSEMKAMEDAFTKVNVDTKADMQQVIKSQQDTIEKIAQEFNAMKGKPLVMQTQPDAQIDPLTPAPQQEQELSAEDFARKHLGWRG